MTPTDKLEMQEAEDGSATVTLPHEENKEVQVVEETEPVEQEASEETSEPLEQHERRETRNLSESEREKLRESRRLERQNKKYAQKKKLEDSAHIIAALKRQNDDLSARLLNVENRTSGAELARVDKSIEDSQLRVQYAQSKISEALKAQDGDAMVKAQEMLYESKKALEQLSAVKQNMLSAAKNPQQNNLQMPDSRVQHNAATWMQKHGWYKPDLSNTDSKIAHAVDVELTNEGWDPATQEYWDELDDRLRDRMPNRFDSDYGDAPPPQQKRKSIVTGSGRESSSTEKAGVFKLDKDRVAAMKETGAWFDPKRKAKMVQYYMDYDKNNSTRN
jgi:hypothetical protein